MVLIWVASAPPRAFAQDPLHKAGRGLTNVATAWVEIPKQISAAVGRAPSFVATVPAGLKGAATGLWLTVARLGLGLYETITFPIPYPRDYASPYEPFGLPQYPWE